MINKQKIISYLQNMKDYVPDQELRQLLWNTNRQYLRTRIVCDDLPRQDKIEVSGTRFELPLDLVSTTDYDHIILNLVENEFESMEDFKLVNHTKRMIDYKYRIIGEDKDWFVIHLNYSWEALHEFVKFLYLIHNDLEAFPGVDDIFYKMVMENDKHLPDLRKTYHMEDLGIRLRFFGKHHGTMYLKFADPETKHKFWEPMRRLNFLRPAY